MVSTDYFGTTFGIKEDFFIIIIITPTTLVKHI